MSYTILQPTFFMESHAEMLVGRPILETGEVSLTGKGDNLKNFVAADDVAKFAVTALEYEALSGKTIGIGGPENLTAMNVVRVYEDLARRKAKVSHQPIEELQRMSRELRPSNPALSQIIEMAVYADTSDCTFDPAPLLAAYPVKLIRLADWAAQRYEQDALG